LQVFISIGDYFISTEIVLVFPFLPGKRLNIICDTTVHVYITIYYIYLGW